MTDFIANCIVLGIMLTVLCLGILAVWKFIKFINSIMNKNTIVEKVKTSTSKTLCKICKTENPDNEYYCSYCGSYLVKYPKAHKWLLIGLIIWPCLLYAIYLGIKDAIKMDEIRKKNNLDYNKIIALAISDKTSSKSEITKIETPMFFMKASEYRKKDSKLTNKKDCIFKVENELFYIIQDNKTVENVIDSIYQMDFWFYEDYYYASIKMRSHVEYMFGVDENAISFLYKLANKYDIKIEDNTCADDKNNN